MGFGGDGVAHYADAVVVWLEGYDFVEADAEPLFGAVEVEVLGGDAEESGVGVDVLVPLVGLAAEGAGAVVEAAGDADAYAVGGAAALAAGDGFDVVDAVEKPDQFFGFEQVEGVAGDVLAFRDDAFGQFAEGGGFDHIEVGAVAVDVGCGEVETGQVAD